MALAPRMIQSMEILQLPIMALQERIEQEMLSNPVLEMEEQSYEGPEQSGSEGNGEKVIEINDDEQSLLIRDDMSRKEDFRRMENIGDDYEDYWSRSSYVPSRSTSGERDGKLEAMQNTAAPDQSLNEYLMDQWAFIEAEPKIKAVGAKIIEYIEETGYLHIELASLCEKFQQPVSLMEMEAALRMIQTLEPVGVGARNLAECLLIQLEAAGEGVELEIELVRNHLKDIEMNRFPQIAKKTGRSIAEIQDGIKKISRLDPRPGMQVGSHNATYIVPDVIVEYDEDDDIYTARLSDGSNPMLRINAMYGKMLKDKKVVGDTKEFLQNSVRSAKWLIESVEQRKATLLRVVNHVLRSQREFFDNGPMYLKPLPMVDVAEELGIHVGTVSRAVSGKYLQTPIGIYPLRYFFSGGTETANGESVSWDAVKAKLQEIIDNENKHKPFNDDELVAELDKRGLTLARRTVAKYRNLMDIPPARRRKVYH